MIKILFVCHGNICRSPMAEFVMKDLAIETGMDLYIASAATSTEEIGNPVHWGTRQKLQQHGIDVSGKVAVQMTKADYTRFDYIIGMDAANIRNILRIAGGDPDGKVSKLLSFTGSERDIADPWYTGNFEETYQDVLEGCKAFLVYIRDEIKE